MLALDTRRMPIPVLLVSGSLGSGKTTLLNHILHNKINLRVTCLVNDLAAQNIDAELLIARDEARKTVHLSNGCVCHALSDEFEEEMWQVLQETDGSDQTDYVVIETSGVVDPVSLVQKLERRYGKMTRARLDGVVIVVDADVLANQLGAEGVEGAEGAETARRRLASSAGPALMRQLACADVVLLNKVDLLSEAQAARTRELVQAAAPWARVHCCSHGKMPLQVCPPHPPHTRHTCRALSHALCTPSPAPLLCTPPLHPSSAPPPLQLLLNVEYVRSDAAGAPGHEARLLAQQGGYLTAAAAPQQQVEGRQARLQAEAEAAPQGEGAITSSGSAPSWAVAPSKQPHDGVRSVTFHSAHPLRLASFQDLLAAGGAGPAAEGEEEGGVRFAPSLTIALTFALTFTAPKAHTPSPPHSAPPPPSPPPPPSGVCRVPQRTGASGADQGRRVVRGVSHPSVRRIGVA